MEPIELLRTSVFKTTNNPDLTKMRPQAHTL